jgi:hypothetical protein
VIRQHIKLINPVEPERDETGDAICAVAPDLAFGKHPILKECAILLRCVQARKPRKASIKGRPMDGCHRIDIREREAP